MAVQLKALTRKNITKKLYLAFCYPFIARYLKKETTYRYRGFSLIVLPGVFHPRFFFSTRFFFSFIDALPLAGKACLEIGCGSGLLSLLMLRKKGRVTAIDIQALAVANTQVNFERNRTQFTAALELTQSDLFDSIPPAQFDAVIINPPYFFADVTVETEHAWYCGSNGEYFLKLFAQLGSYVNATSDIYMILADNCDITRINAIAGRHGFALQLLTQKSIWWETNYVFKIVQAGNALS